jgi:hypothetical protein
MAVIAGLKILNEIEENEKSFVDCGFHVSSESESDDETNLNLKKHPKVCRRQNNIMPNGRLSETLEDINCELMKRVDSNASNYQPSPKTTHRLLSLSGSKLSSEDSKTYSRSSS